MRAEERASAGRQLGCNLPGHARAAAVPSFAWVWPLEAHYLARAFMKSAAKANRIGRAREIKRASFERRIEGSTDDRCMVDTRRC